MFKYLIYSFAFYFLLSSSTYSYAQDNTIKVNGASLHYQVFGKGEPILIINGGPGMNSNGFGAMAKELAKNYQTILYDQRGTGLSKVAALNSENISMDLMVKDIEALRQHLGFEKWIVLGHSFGGIMAYYYASHYPEKVKAMIQSSSGGIDLQLLERYNLGNKLSAMELDSMRFYEAKIQEGDTTYATLLKRAQFMAPAYLYKKEFVPVIAERLTEIKLEVNGIVWADLRHMNYDAKAKMSGFEKPVLIIQGKDDLLDVSLAKKANKILPNSQLALLDRCGHYGWLDRPDVYFQLINEFIASLN